MQELALGSGFRFSESLKVAVLNLSTVECIFLAAIMLYFQSSCSASIAQATFGWRCVRLQLV